MTPPTAGAPEPWHVVATLPAQQPLPPPAPRRRGSWRRWAVVVSVPAALALAVGLTVRAVYEPPEVLTTSAGPLVQVPGGSYSFATVHSDGTPVRWNPCQPVHVVANLADAPAGAEADLVGALAVLSAASGIELVYEGPTTESAAGERSAYQPVRYGERWAPVLVAWDDLRSLSLPQTSETVGIGTPTSVSHGGGPRTYVSAQVVLNARRSLQPGFDTPDGWGGVLLHELGHGLGLGHTPDPGEVMYDGGLARTGPAALGPGDVAGLARIGRAGGCLTTPPARDIP